MDRKLIASTIAVTALAGHVVVASGHGPLFGAATPTLGKGGWEFDQAWMGQVMKAPDGGGQILRTMVSTGITDRVQISLSAPIPLGTTDLLPSGRMMSMMSFNRDLETLGAWRFQSRPVGDTARAESTVYIGGTIPLTSQIAGLHTAPSTYFAASTGYASRSHYFWAGASHQHALESNGDRFGSVTSFTIVYGYRPPAWRTEYPKPDLRFFVESVSDSTSPARHMNQSMPDTGGHVALVGPTFLLLYKAYGIEGGALFPVYQHVNGTQPQERFRFGVNFTYFFWPGGRKGH
jgi:hypothetical protein